MSRTPLPFAPDPTKWIDTSKSSSKTRPKPQRPLAGWKNGVNTSTPPATIRKSNIWENDTPLTRQIGLKGYLTPPTTGPTYNQKKGIERIRRQVEKELNTPLASKVPVNKRIDDFWGSSSDGEPGPSRLAPKDDGRLKRVEVYQDAEDVEEEDQVYLPDPNRKSQIVGRSPRRTMQSTQTIRNPLRSSHLASTRKASKSPSRSHSPPNLSPDQPPSSSPRPRTPIPSHVLREHKQLCGHLTDQMKKIKSPWKDFKPVQHSSPIKAPDGSPYQDIENRVLSKQATKTMGKKDLVSLSDESSDEVWEKRKRGDDDRRVLKSLKVNAGTRSKEFVNGFNSPSKRLKRTTSKRLTLEDNEQNPTLSPVRLQHPGRTATVSPARRRPLPPTNENADHASPSQRKTTPLESDHPPTTSPPVPLTPHAPSPLTPRKPKQKAISPHHHQITPPKNKTPQKLKEHSETLFAFPPPPQPDFGSPMKKAAPKKDWNPVEMNAETLMTWSLGGARSESTKAMPLAELVQKDGKAHRHGDADTSRPLPTPIQSGKRKRSQSQSSDTESLAASIPSESFPNFVHSSPKKSSNLLLSSEMLVTPAKAEDVPMPPSRQPSRSQPSRPDLPPSSPLKANGAGEDLTDAEEIVTPRPIANPAEERWKSLRSGILSIPPPEPAPTAQSEKSLGKKRKSQTPKKNDKKSQTKLAAFGFFPDEPEPMSGSLQETFEKKWEAEPDLEFEAEMDRIPSPSNSGRVGVDRPGESDDRSVKRKVGPVPEAPHHPDLRPAGIAELAKRERRRQEKESQKSMQTEEEVEKEKAELAEDRVFTLDKLNGNISSDPSSDLSSSDPLFPEESAHRGARAWFEGIGNRRSSEFGSFKSDP